VEILGAPEAQEALRLLLETVSRFRKDDVGSIAVICKTADQAAALYGQIRGKSALQLVKDASQGDLSRSLLLPLNLVKGLEFDGVILWDVSAENYGWPEQRRLLYLAASRALHRLALLFTDQLSPLVQEGQDPAVASSEA
jgi:DNA helicase-2/ATP-dependent DNA helicase PcrA